MQNMSFSGIDVPDELIDKYRTLETRIIEATNATKLLTGSEAKQAAADLLGELNREARAKKDEIAKTIAEVKGEFATLPPFLQNLISPTVASVDSLNAGVSVSAGRLVKDTSAIFADFKNLAAGSLGDIFSAVGESIGTKSAKPLQNVLKTILSGMADLMIKIGTAMLLSSKLFGLAAIFNPGVAPLSIGQGITGAKLIGGGALVKPLQRALE